MSDSEAQETLAIQREAAVEQFCHVTGANADTASRTLEACNWNLELAINMHVDSVECLDPGQVAPSLEPSPMQQTASSSSARPSENHNDEVRAPIPPVRQVLVEDGYAPSFRARHNPFSPVFDAFRDFQAEARWQEEMQQTPDRDDAGRHTKRRTLELLFRPPLDLLFRGSMDSAREEGSKQNKWLMVNVQNVQEFSCQVLNRDLWSNHAVKSIVAEHFIFWQVYHDSNEGQRYMQFYNVHQFPYIAILDPRTGEKLRTYNTTDPMVFCDQVTEFLGEHPSPNGTSTTTGSTATTTTTTTTVSEQSQVPTASSSASSSWTANKYPYEETEEMQLKAAIQASLEDTCNHSSETKETQIEYESDELETFDSDTEDSVNYKDGAAKKSGPSGNTNKEDTEEVCESWEKYLGDTVGKKSELMIRFPDGKREQVSFPADSKLKALFLYVSSQGYDMKEYDVVTNFPMRNLQEISSSETLSDVGLFPRETVYVRHKS